MCPPPQSLQHACNVRCSGKITKSWINENCLFFQEAKQTLKYVLPMPGSNKEFCSEPCLTAYRFGKCKKGWLKKRKGGPVLPFIKPHPSPRFGERLNSSLFFLFDHVLPSYAVATLQEYYNIVSGKCRSSKVKLKLPKQLEVPSKSLPGRRQRR